MSLTQNQLRGLAALRAKAHVNDANGVPNLVARVRPTRKGEKLEIDGKAVGSKGRDGSAPWYLVREAAEHRQGPVRLYCSCPVGLNRGNPNRVCKHVKLMLAVASEIMDNGDTRNVDVSIANPDAIDRALGVVGRKMTVREVCEAIGWSWIDGTTGEHLSASDVLQEVVGREENGMIVVTDREVFAARRRIEEACSAVYGDSMVGGAS